MRIPSGWVFTLSALWMFQAEAASYSVDVAARENSLRDGQLAQVALPLGELSLIIQPTGSAEYEPGGLFNSLVLEYKDGLASVCRDVPIGETTSLHIGNSLGYPLQFFFVDRDPSDNTGSVQITISGSISGTVIVSPALHCLL